MCQDVCIEINEVVENISIEVRDFSVSNIISQDVGNSIVLGDDGLLFSPTSGGGGGSVESVNGILPDVNGNVVVPIPTVPDFATELEVNAGVVSNKTIAPNTLSGWWAYVKGLAQTFAQKITFSSGALFSPQVAPTYEKGRIYFDDANDCISFMDSISGTSVQVGYEVLMRARNNTGATIPNGSVVYISGAIGQNSTVALAQANTLPTSEIIGIATHDIANNTVGKICVFGLVNDLNTSSFTDGQMLYLSASVSGGLTSSIPASPNFVVALGVVEHSHPTQGKILVRPQRALANNNSLGTSQSISPTQNAVKTANDLKQDVLNAINLGQIIYNELAIKSTPSADDEIVMYDSLTGEAVTAKFSSFGGALACQRFQASGLNPADATYYNIGGSNNVPPLSTTMGSYNVNRTIKALATGNIKKVLIFFSSTSGSSSGESSTIKIKNVTQTTEVTISTTMVTDMGTFQQITNVSLAVTQGDELVLEWLTPTYVTNPISVVSYCEFTIE